VAPGTVHAYLSGVGVEVMKSSDNVIRLGLTSKSVNLPEAFRVLRTPGTPPRTRVPRGDRSGVCPA